MLDALLDKEEAKNSLRRIVVDDIFVVLKRVADFDLRMGKSVFDLVLLNVPISLSVPQLSYHFSFHATI